MAEAGFDAESLRNELSKWRTPDEFRKLVELIDSRTEAADLWRSHKFKFLRDDALSLAKLTTHISLDCIRLCKESEQWPDGQVRIGGQVINVEITAAHEQGRRIADEYRPDAPRLMHVDEDVLYARAEMVPAAVEDAIKCKIDRNYSSRSMLVIYLNIGSHGIRQEENEAAIKKIKARHAADFLAIHILWGNKLL